MNGKGFSSCVLEVRNMIKLLTMTGINWSAQSLKNKTFPKKHFCIRYLALTDSTRHGWINLCIIDSSPSALVLALTNDTVENGGLFLARIAIESITARLRTLQPHSNYFLWDSLHLCLIASISTRMLLCQRITTRIDLFIIPFHWQDYYENAHFVVYLQPMCFVLQKS
jgi:hypothetical protein